MSAFVLIYDYWLAVSLVTGLLLVMSFFIAPFITSILFVSFSFMLNIFYFLMAKSLFISGMILLFVPLVSFYAWFN